MTEDVNISLTSLVRDAYRCLGWRLIALLLIMPISALLEGLSLTLLFPVLSQFGIGAQGPASPLAEAINTLLAFLGVPPDLSSLLIFVALVLQFQVGATLLRGWLESLSQVRYMSVWQGRLFHAFIGADWTYSMSERSAGQVAAIISETGRVSAALNLMVQMTGCAIMAIIYAGLSIASAWQVVVFLAIFGVVAFGATRPLIRRGGYIGRQVSLSAEEMHHRTQEFLHNLKLIKATATEGAADAIFNDAIIRFRDASFRENIHPKLVLAIYTSLGFLMLCSGIWASFNLLHLHPAAIVVSIYVFLRLYVQLSNLQGFRQSFAAMAPALTTVKGLLDRATAAAERTHGGERLPGSGGVAIDLRGVEVRYGDHVALSDVTCRIPAGSVAGITGSSGAGKSTLVDAIVGLIRPAAGEVRIDDLALDSLDIPNWRRAIGYVGQETLLMRSTVAENIAWGFEGAGPDAIREAAKLAHADDFITALPNGYDTMIGDRGVRLSGGQRQRLGLARALLGNRRLLILDEATSALDSESEAKVLEAVSSLRGRVTVIMVAHRLSTLRLADTILVFESSRLAEWGSFGDLVSAKGRFAHLWQIQSESAESYIEKTTETGA